MWDLCLAILPLPLSATASATWSLHFCCYGIQNPLHPHCRSCCILWLAHPSCHSIHIETVFLLICHWMTFIAAILIPLHQAAFLLTRASKLLMHKARQQLWQPHLYSRHKLHQSSKCYNIYIGCNKVATF